MSEPIQLARTLRRKMQKFASAVDRITKADRIFFERFPHRKNRVRFAGKAEVDQHSIVDGNPPPPPGYRFYVAVRNVAPGYRLRQFIVAAEGLETDLPEEAAWMIYEQALTPKMREVEADLRRLAEERK